MPSWIASEVATDPDARAGSPVLRAGLTDHGENVPCVPEREEPGADLSWEIK